MTDSTFSGKQHTMEMELDTNCGESPKNREKSCTSLDMNKDMTAGQQIRAKALECATRYLCQEIRPSKDSFWATVEDIEHYIREGK